jgi:hypothetical protein
MGETKWKENNEGLNWNHGFGTESSKMKLSTLYQFSFA